MSKKKLLRRIENLCLYFKENMPKYKNSLKRVDGEKTSYKRSRREETTGLDYSTGKTKFDPAKPVTALKVEKDSDGNIVYPIVVT